MAPKIEFAEGLWCEDCEFFEVEDIAVDGTCLSCGCPKERHAEVVVVER